jgi:hypothetical protein
LQTTDQLCLTLAALTRAPALDLKRAESLFNLNVTGNSPALAGLTIDGESFASWAPRNRPAKLGDMGADADPVNAGWDGTSDIRLVAGGTAYAVRIHYPPPTDLTADQVMDFIAARKASNYLFSRITDPLDMHAVVLAFSNEAVPPEDRKAWHEFHAAHRVRRPPTFELVRADACIVRELGSLALRERALLDAAERNAVVADFYNDKEWAGHFRSCASAPPMEIFGETGMSAEAMRLIGIVARAWVFGGMGSWNDVAYTEDVEYRKAAPALLTECKLSIMASAKLGWD